MYYYRVVVDPTPDNGADLSIAEDQDHHSHYSVLSAVLGGHQGHI